MPTSPLKRQSAGGRLGRLLASLRPPAKAGPLPIQTGFPTSLADLVVRNHGRLKNPARRRHRSSSAAAAAPPVAVVAAAEPVVAQQRRELSVVAARDAAAAARQKGAGFSIRLELLAVGGVLALALLVIWSKWLVAVATLASVALLWIEAARSPVPRSVARPETKEALDLCGRGRVSPIREAESAAETPRSSCADSDKGSECEGCSPCATDTTADLADDDSNSIGPKRKEKRRSLRKLIAKKFHNGNRSRDKDSPGGESKKRTDAGEAAADVAGPVAAEPEPFPAEQTTPAEEEATAGERRRQGGALRLAALVPVVLVGLVAGKVPAVALTVLCAVFFSSAERVPASYQ